MKRVWTQTKPKCGIRNTQQISHLCQGRIYYWVPVSTQMMWSECFGVFFSFDWLCQILCPIRVAKWVVRCRSFAESQSLASIVVKWVFNDLTEREREMFYLTTHSTHFIYGYMASDIWLRTILIVRKETRCRHIGYSFRLTARVLLYAPSHRQDNTYWVDAI